MKFLVFVVFAVLSSTSAEQSRYDNYRVYKVSIENSQQLSALSYLAENSDSYSFFDNPGGVGQDVELIVPPHKFSDFSEIVKNLNFKSELTISNLQELHDKQTPNRKRKDDGVMGWTDYQSIETIYAWLDSLQTEFSSFVNVTTIGTSFHGRPLKLLKLSKKAGNRAIFVECQIHAREWIASATCTYIINELLRSTNNEVRDLADNVDWYIIPLTNPDGYEYTRTENRNWRKTRSYQSPLCTGVDPNRNWGYNWMVPDEYGVTGSSTSPCSDVFAGTHPFSEPETAAVNQFLTSHRGIFDIYLAMHSYDHSILLPYGNSRTILPNQEELNAVAHAAMMRLNSTHGITYRYGNQAIILYAASGNSQDHAYGEHKIPISYTYEMRGSGNYGNFGFFLPPQFILPNAEEILQSYIGLVQEARRWNRLQIV